MAGPMPSISAHSSPPEGARAKFSQTGDRQDAKLPRKSPPQKRTKRRKRSPDQQPPKAMRRLLVSLRRLPPSQPARSRRTSPRTWSRWQNLRSLWCHAVAAAQSTWDCHPTSTRGSACIRRPHPATLAAPPSRPWMRTVPVRLTSCGLPMIPLAGSLERCLARKQIRHIGTTFTLIWRNGKLSPSVNERLPTGTQVQRLTLAHSASTNDRRRSAKPHPCPIVVAQ